jgi:hypothetical protein
MNSLVVQLLSRAIVRLMNRDRKDFERLAILSEKEHDQGRHLYVTIEEVMRSKNG